MLAGHLCVLVSALEITEKNPTGSSTVGASPSGAGLQQSTTPSSGSAAWCGRGGLMMKEAWPSSKMKKKKKSKRSYRYKSPSMGRQGRVPLPAVKIEARPGDHRVPGRALGRMKWRCWIVPAAVGAKFARLR